MILKIQGASLSTDFCWVTISHLRRIQSKHRDVFQQPFVANAVIAAFDIPFQDPLGHVLVAQVDKALRNGICLTSLFPEASGFIAWIVFIVIAWNSGLGGDPTIVVCAGDADCAFWDATY